MEKKNKKQEQQGFILTGAGLLIFGLLTLSSGSALLSVIMMIMGGIILAAGLVKPNKK